MKIDFQQHNTIFSDSGFGFADASDVRPQDGRRGMDRDDRDARDRSGEDGPEDADTDAGF